MKSLDFLKEGFVEDASEAHQDHEVQMARQECFNTAENALALHKLLRNISEAQGLEGWVSSKITLANDYLKRVREYLEYEFLTKDINEITPQITIAENAESKKKLIEYKIVSGQEGKTQNYVITGLDTKTLDQLARAYYGAIKLEQDPKNQNVTTIIWDLPTAGPAPYGSYDAKSGTATFIKKMTDAGDQLAKSVKKIDQAVEESLDLDQQAMSVARQLTSGKNLEKLQAMRHDSTVYRALDRYFAKNNIPENIYNRVANIVFKRINTQGVAEAQVTQLPTQGADYSKYDTDHLKMLLRPGILHRNEARFKALIRKELQKREQQSQQGVADGSDKTFTVKYYSKKTGRNVTRQIKASSESELWDRLRTKGIDVVSVKEQGVAEQQDDPYRTNTEQNMDSVAQFKVGQKVIFTSPLNNKKYEAVVTNIYPGTGSIEVFIPLNDQGGGVGTYASPKNLQPMQQEVAEAFGAGRAEDFAVHPKSAREKIGANIATLGMITGAIAGFTLTPDGFWGTTGGILGGMFVGATLGREIHGNKDAKIRQEKMKKLASNFVSSQPGLKYDFEVFLNSLYNDSPFNKLGALNHWEDIEDVYDKQKELLDREIRQWLDHYEKEWESLNNAYKIPNTWLLRYAFELIYGKSVMEQWLDKMRKMGERGIYRTPFSSLDTTNKNNTHPNDPNDRIEPTLNLDKFQEGVAKGKKCNHTMEGTECPIHGLTECPMQENKKLKETSAGSVAGVNNPPGKNSGKKKSQIGSLFGGTYKQTVHETDFAGEKTTPPQKPGDQVRGTEKPIKKGKQQPFYHRLVGNE
jgi:hypothetical protein